MDGVLGLCCCLFLSFLSSFAFILLKKRELIALFIVLAVVLLSVFCVSSLQCRGLAYGI